MAALSRRAMILPGASIELEKVDLRGADLAGHDLSRFCFAGSNLEGANLTGCDLTGTTFSGASLKDANLTGATLTGADFNGAELSGTAGTGMAPGAPAAPAPLPVPGPALIAVTPTGARRPTLTVLLCGDVIDRCVEDPHHCENGEEGRFDYDHSFDVPHRGYGKLRLGRQLFLGHAALFAKRSQPRREPLGLLGITALGTFLPTRPSHAAILAINFYQ
jgi:hypothetical protein